MNNHHHHHNNNNTGYPFIGYLSGYCDNSGCPARELEVKIKHRDKGSLPAPRCPLCGSWLQHVERQTLQEHQQREEQQARCSVNVQRYVRDYCPPDQLQLIPAAVLRDDQLPGEKYPRQQPQQSDLTTGG